MHRFELASPTRITSVGASFKRSTALTQRVTVFAAVVSLTGSDDFPDNADLTGDDVVGTTLIDVTEQQGLAMSDLSLVLPAGWYALQVGYGAFGAPAEQAPTSLLVHAIDGDPSQVTWAIRLPSHPAGFLRIPHAPIPRFVVEGVAVPEPSTLAIAILPVALCAANRPQ